MKFKIETWQNADGTFTGYCSEKRGWLDSGMGLCRYKKLDGFKTREEALEAIHKVIDMYLTPKNTTKQHGVYP